MILGVALNIAMALLALAFLASFLRLIKGPTQPDRILALDTMSVNAIATIVLLGIEENNAVYFEAALLVALMGFITTVALTKFLLRGDIIE